MGGRARRAATPPGQLVRPRAALAGAAGRGASTGHAQTPTQAQAQRLRPSAGSTQRAGAQVQDVSEQLDCVLAQFLVLRHIRGKYACACCQTIQAAPMPAQIIDKGIPAPGLLAQVVIAKHDDHLPLYRQEEIYARSGVHIPRSSMAQWVGTCGLRLAPLAAALREYILTHSVIHADRT